MWTKEQKEAIEYNDKSVLVSAAAGSGKTAVLIERVITKVITEKIDIDKLLILTFTKAAALEMKERLLKAIYKKLDEGNNVSFLKRQLTLVNKAYITTIHSFCLDVVKSNFYILGMDVNFNIDNEAIKILKRDINEELLEEKYLSKSEEFYDILNMFNFKDEEFLNLIEKIYAYSLNFENPLSFLKSAIDKYNIKDVNVDITKFDFGFKIFNEAKNQVITNINKTLVATSKYDIAMLKTIHSDIARLEDLTYAITYDEFFNKLINLKFDKFSFIKVETENDAIAKEDIMRLRKLYIKDHIKKLQDKLHSNSHDLLCDLKHMYKYLKYIYDYINEFDNRINKMKQKEGIIDFTDIEHLCLKALNDNPTYLNNLKDKFAQVYTDEYQDTSTMQEKIISKIANEDNRFMVGDIKQSIYKFRNASPEIFLEKYKGIDNHVILLAKNFRSRSEVLDFTNYIFERVMSSDIGDCEYKTEEMLHLGNTGYTDNDDYKTVINIVDKKSKDNLEDNILEELNELKNFEVEAKYIAMNIKSMVGKFKLNNKVCDYKDIVILLRKVSILSDILVKTFKEYDIPVFVDNNVNMFENDEVNYIISLLKVINNPLDDIALVSVLYSHIGNFTLNEIYNLKKNKTSVYTSMKDYNKDDNTKVKIDNFLNKLNEYVTLSKIYSTADFLTHIYIKTNIYHMFSKLTNASEVKANLDNLINIASKLNSSSLYSYISHIESLKEKTVNVTSAKQISETDNVVRIMSIHKSKGLEFPVVIIANASAKYNLRDMNNKVVFDKIFGLGVDIFKKDTMTKYSSIIKEAICQDMLTSIKSEELRLLYTALTRAREKIIIYATMTDFSKYIENQNIVFKDKKVDSNIIKNNNSYIENILSALCKDIDINKLDNHDNKCFKINILNYLDIIKNNENKTINIDLSNYNEKLYNEVKENLSFKYTGFINFETKTTVTKLKEKPKTVKLNKFSILTDDKKYSAARKGTLVHFIIEYLDFNKVNSIDDLRECILNLNKQNLITEEDFKNININKIYEFLNSKIGKDIKEASLVKKEYEFIYKDESITKSVIQGIIDMFYKDIDGKYILVDFKTDNIDDEDKFKELYRMQLDIYKKALENLCNIKIDKMYIYSFKLGKEIEIN